MPFFPASPSIYRRNVLMPLGDSQTNGSQSTAAIQSAGYRWVLDQLARALGLALKFVGDQQTGSFANNWHQGVGALDLDAIRINSRAARQAVQPDGILLNGGINTLTATTAAAAATAMTNLINDCWDLAAHNLPGGGSTLRWMLVTNVLRYQFDLVTVNPKVIDFNTNFLPGVVAAQVAQGRNVVILDGYSRVPSIGADLIHPDDTGYTQWATAQIAVLQQMGVLRAA